MVLDGADTIIVGMVTDGVDTMVMEDGDIPTTVTDGIITTTGETTIGEINVLTTLSAIGTDNNKLMQEQGVPQVQLVVRQLPAHG